MTWPQKILAIALFAFAMYWVVVAARWFVGDVLGVFWAGVANLVFVGFLLGWVVQKRRAVHLARELGGETHAAETRRRL